MEQVNATWQFISAQLPTINLVSISVRLLLAVMIGSLIGVNRSRRRRPAGVKTHVLVCIGAAMVMITSQYMVQNLGNSGDMGRMGAQVISGIGFLGAGTILVTGQHQVRGLTTAAGLWCSACLGLAAGIGFYEGVLVACLFVSAILVLTPHFSPYINGKTFLLEFYLEVDDPSSISEVIAHIKSTNCTIMDITIGSVKYSGIKGSSIQASLLLKNGLDHSEIMASIGKIKGVRLIEEISEA